MRTYGDQGSNVERNLYVKDKGCVTRMGFKQGVTREQIQAAIGKFGKSDEIYDLMKSYKVYENETWMVS